MRSSSSDMQLVTDETQNKKEVKKKEPELWLGTMPSLVHIPVPHRAKQGPLGEG